jgi:hypothetical protein
MNWLKATGLSAAALILSSVLAMQAITNVLANDQPALAASASPLNGFALERVALNRLENQTDGSLTPLVKNVLAKEPLSPVAWTILALAQQDEAKKDAILLAASELNRRTLMLQSNLLLYYASRDDFFNSIGVLNQILTVYPEQQEIMFPILINALKDERSIPEFTQALSNKPDWSDKFMKAASGDRNALANLGRLRMSLFDKLVVDPNTDKAVINALINAGQLDSAAALYRKISEPSSDGVVGSAGRRQRLDWSTKMPPFDWQLNGKPGARAQIVEEPERLEFFVTMRKAGVLAERILTVPQSFTLEIKHKVSPVEQLEDVRIELQCEKTKNKFFDQPLTQTPSKYSIGPIPPDCEAVRLSLLARAWSDKENLSGQIYSIQINSR